MRTDLNVGLLQETPGWLCLLRQIGVPYLELMDVNDLYSFGVVIVNRVINAEEAKRLEQWIRDGGAVLDTGFLYSFIHRKRTHQVFRKYIVTSDQDGTFEDLGLIDIASAFNTIDESSVLAGAVHTEKMGEGVYGFIGFPVEEMMTQHRIARLSFYAEDTPAPSEIVSRVSRSKIRLILTRLLKEVNALRQLPFIHLWHFPGETEQLFTFRIDSDYGSATTVDKLHHMAHAYNIPLTWFLHVQAHQDWMHVFKEYEANGDEIALHGYQHQTSSRYEDNKANLDVALELVNKAGFNPTGFSAPFGDWNENLALALQDSGIVYSSEFSLDYDNLPFFPFGSVGHFSTLQIPVHPICIGSFKRSIAQGEHIKSYFDHVIDDKYQLHEPTMLYHHPLHEGWDILEHLFKRVNEGDYLKTTLGEYARFWLKRSKVWFTASTEPGNMKLTSNLVDDDLTYMVHFPDNRAVLHALQADVLVPLKTVKFGKQHPYSADDLVKSRTVNKQFLKDYLLSTISRLGQ